jgi:hypothetical protein
LARKYGLLPPAPKRPPRFRLIRPDEDEQRTTAGEPVEDKAR